MFLLYADASGTADQQDHSKHYVLLGLCVPEGHWFALNRLLQSLKTRYCQPGQDFELHAAEFCVSINEQTEIPDFDQLSRTDRRAKVQALRQQRIDAEKNSKKKKARIDKYRRTEQFIHLTRLERSRLLEDALDLVGANDRIRLFGEAIHKAHPAVASGQVDPVHQAFEQVTSRFDAYLQMIDHWKLKKSPRRKIDNGLIVLDKDYSTEAAIQDQFKRYRQHGHPWGQMRHVIDVPMFASSDLVCGLQLVDACAYAVRRYLDTQAVVGSHEERNFLRIFHRFDQDGQGNLHGLRHYVATGTCACLACQRRGHAPTRQVSMTPLGP
jgi:hypothetical protein